MPSFSDLTPKEKLLEAIRWLLVPVAATMSVVALIALSRVVMPPALAQLPGTPVVPPSDFHRYVLPRVFGVVMAAAFVVAGAKVAPRGRFATAVVLAIAWIGYSFLIHVFVHLGRGAPNLVHFLLAAVAAAGAAAYVGHSKKSKGRQQGEASAYSAPETPT